jgi:hypothetical protein
MPTVSPTTSTDSSFSFLSYFTDTEYMIYVDIGIKMFLHLIKGIPVVLIAMLAILTLAMPEKANWRLRIIVAYLVCSEAFIFLDTDNMWNECTREVIASLTNPLRCHLYRVYLFNILLLKMYTSSIYIAFIYLFLTTKGGKFKREDLLHAGARGVRSDTLHIWVVSMCTSASLESSHVWQARQGKNSGFM